MKRKQRSMFEPSRAQIPEETPPRASMGSVLDWFRKFSKPKVESQLPAVYEEKPLSFLESLKRAATGLPIERPTTEITQKPGLISKAITPFVEVARAARAAAPVKAEKPTEPSPERLQIFRDLYVPEEAIQAARPQPIREIPRKGKGTLLERTRWQLPTTLELVEKLKNSWELPILWETVLSNVESPSWEKKVREAAHRGEPASIPLQLVTSRQDPYGDMAHFLGIPDAVIEQYAERSNGAERFESEVIGPIAERVGKALDILKPSHEIFGWFDLMPDDDMNYWLVYSEQPIYPERR